MASSTVIPAIKDIITLKHGIMPLDSQHYVPTDIDHITTISRSSTHSQLPRRSTSAISLNNTSSLYYTRCIDFLQEQHKLTLQKLHQEVQELKQENKKLHFKILVENDGVMNVARKNLPLKLIGTKNRPRDIDEDILLKETIKDLQVKLNISDDTNSHLKSTIKGLNKQMSLVKRTSHHEPRLPSTASLFPAEKSQSKLIVHLRQQNETQAKQIQEYKELVKTLQLSMKSSKNVHQIGNTSSPPATPSPTATPRSRNYTSPRVQPSKSRYLPPLNITAAAPNSSRTSLTSRSSFRQQDEKEGQKSTSRYIRKNR